MASLAYGPTTIALSDNLLWVDEFPWQPVAAKGDRSITGRLTIEQTVKSGGRPITLQADDQSSGCARRSTVDQLYTAAQLAGQAMTLTYRSTAYSVVFDHEQIPVEAKPLVDYAAPASNDWYSITLRFLLLP